MNPMTGGKMYFYAQFWSERAFAWITEGDAYKSLEKAKAQLADMRKFYKNYADDRFRVVCYPTSLSSKNASLRVGR